jgi:hypothetical protein
MAARVRNHTAIYVGGLLITGLIIVAGTLFSGHLQPSPETSTVITPR